MTRITAVPYPPAGEDGTPGHLGAQTAPGGWADVAQGVVQGTAPPHPLDACAPFVLLDDVEGGSALLFSRLRSIIVAHAPHEVAAALDTVRRVTEAGNFAAGYLAYEAGLGFEPTLRALAPIADPARPLLWFGVFDAPERIADVERWLPSPGSAWNSAPVPRIGRHDYAAAHERILAMIGNGDLYQANLTFGASVKVAGPPLGLYARLRAAQRARWGGVVFTGNAWLLSASPELFVACVDGALTARPMKGTVPRGASPQADADAAGALQSSEKDRAENLMIVDLMRNDLGRIAETGTVQVPAMFTIEGYPTVWQMTSTVTATLRADLGPVDAIARLFPCGSVTGAPKIRAMEAIAEIEGGPRGAYTGSIGFVGGAHAVFNVAIRTIELADGADEGRVGLGSGIVADSQADLEWAECGGKGRFLTRDRPPVRLLETMRFAPGEGVARLDGHVRRMMTSALAFGYPFAREALDAALDAALAGASAVQRVRLLLGEDGRFAVALTALPDPPGEPVRVALRALPVAPDDFRLRHKTDDRAFYDDARAAAGAFEVLFRLPNGHLTEGSFTNLFVARGGRLATPAGPLIPGVLRAELIAQGRAFEDEVFVDDLRRGFWIGNAVRGLMRAELAGPESSIAQ